MSGYTKKDEVTLAWLDNREKIQLQGRQLLRRVLNEALTELDKQFNEALENGDVLELDASKEELKALLLATAQRELAPGEIEYAISG